MTRGLAVLLAAGGLWAAEPAAYDKIDALYFHRDQPDKLEASIAALELLVKSRPADPELLWRLGRSLLRAGESQSDRKAKLAAFERAEVFLKESVRLAPRTAVAHFWLGAAIGLKGQTRGVTGSLFMISSLKKEMRTVLELEPRYGGAHQVLGQLYLQLPRLLGGGRRKALAEFELALEQSPDYAQNYVPLAAAYLDAGEKEKARLVLDRLFRLKDTSDPPALPESLKQGRELEARLTGSRRP